MSQLGRCSNCQSHFMIVKGTDKDGIQVEIPVCPQCMMRPARPKNNASLGKTLDKYGMEILEK